MRLGLGFLVIWMFSAAAGAEDCATRYSELGKTPRLQSMQLVLLLNSEVGYVNETRGSYFVIDTREDMQVTFLTTALFDLYSIHRKGPLKICDDGQSLFVEGIGRRERLVLDGTKLLIGGDGPRQRYSAGPMPDHLRKLASTP
jgi:hypothetical protein